MKISQKHNLLFYFILCLFFAQTTKGQDLKSTAIQDPKIEQLIKEKRKINLGLTSNETYKIQIFYGNSDDSKKNYKNLEENL
jgi:hypothetical protein